MVAVLREAVKDLVDDTSTLDIYDSYNLLKPIEVTFPSKWDKLTANSQDTKGAKRKLEEESGE